MDADYATVKLSPEGERLWVARYNNDGASPHLFYGATAIALDNQGEILVTGCGGGQQDNGFHTVKYDQDGNRLWNAALEQNSFCPSGLAVNSDGVYVAGMAIFGIGYFYLVKYDSSGVEEWRDAVRGLEAGRDYSATAVAVDSEARVHATGGTLDVFGGAYFFVLPH